ncbi:MAG TPA: peptide ABC transporter substrate-binding protein [Spirochaetia bacterium]|nr:peptide ABC transporter substrate-binding protein [Spirochaetia bacterium]
MRKSRLLLVVLAALALPALAFATEINIRMAVNPDTLDPTLVYTGDVNFITKMLFVNLCDFDETRAVPTPDLAKSWEVSKDGLVWTFHLRNDVQWTNGRPVTARDVEYSMKRILDPATASPLGFYMYMIKNSKAVNTGKSKDMDSVGIKALDDWTIQFTLDKPLGFFPTQIRTVAFAAPKEAIDTFGARWFEPPNIISNGPYMLQSWKQNDRLVFVKNPNYYDAKNVKIDKVTVFVVTDDSTAMAMYEAGQLDTTSVPSGDIDRVAKDPVLSKQTRSVPQLISYMFQFNVTQPPMDNVNVRKALAAALDKESIVKYVTKGGQVAMDTVTPFGAFGAVPKAAHIGIPFDPAAARGYLAKAGYPGGKGLPQITLNFNTSELNQAVAQAAQQMWKKNLGIDVQLKNIEGKVYWDAITSGNLQFWRMGVNADVPDADAFVYSTGHTTDSDRILKWQRKDFDAIVEKARSEPDPEVRKQLYIQAEKIMDQDEAVVIPIYSYAYVAITKPTLNRQYSSLMADTIKNWSVTQ